MTKTIQRKHLTNHAILAAVAGFGYDAVDELSKTFPRKVVLSKFSQLVTRNLLDYGVSSERPFLTIEGRMFLSKT